MVLPGRAFRLSYLPHSSKGAMPTMPAPTDSLTRPLLRLLLPLVLGVLPPCAAARMYQWVDAQTGTVQLSGSPPAWYRDAQPGPRVFVFENGQLIDDTARSLTADDAARLRAAAFGQPTPASPALAAPIFEAPPVADTAETPAPVEDSTSAQIAEFKALLEAYDRAETAAAQGALEDAAGVLSAPPPGASPP